MKHFFIILLSFNLIFCFSVSAFAVEKNNLIDPEFKNWTIYEGNVSISSYGDINTIFVRPSSLNGGSLPWFTIYDLPNEIEIGHKYQLTFNVRDDPAFVGGGAGLIGIKDCFDTYGGFLAIGLASLVTIDNTSFYQIVEGCSVVINEDNYSNFLNTITEFSFEMPSGLVNPCIVVSFATYIPEGSASVNSSVYLVFDDGFTFIDLDTQEEDNFIGKITGWFEEKFIEFKQDIDDFFTKFKNLFLYFDIDGDKNYVNLFPIDDSSVNGADDFDVVLDGLDELVVKFRQLANYIIVPCTMLTDFGEKFVLVPPLVMVSLIGLVAMRLFGVRRDS